MKVKTKEQIAKDTLGLIDNANHYQVVGMVQLQVQDDLSPQEKLMSLYVTNDHLIGTADKDVASYSDDANGVYIASYHSPMGAIVANQIGDSGEVSLPKINREWEVVQKNFIDPHGNVDMRFLYSDGSTDRESNLRNFYRNVINNARLHPMQDVVRTVVAAPEKPADSWDVFLQDTINLSETVDEKPKQFNLGIRDVKKDFYLSGQYILDSVQDKIMRESPYTRRVLLGAAGTGKTTTMIKKLGMNIDKRYSNITSESNTINTWYMFTPTELLKGYLKEAFAKEGIGAPDENVFVWGYFTRGMGKDLRILKDINKPGFELSDTDFFQDVSAGNLINVYKDFMGWRANKFRQSLQDIYDKSQRISDQEISNLLSNGFNAKEPSVFDNNLSIKEIFERIDSVTERQFIPTTGLPDPQDDPFLVKLDGLLRNISTKIVRRTLDYIKNYKKLESNAEITNFLINLQTYMNNQLNIKNDVSVKPNEILNDLVVKTVFKFLSGANIIKKDAMVIQYLNIQNNKDTYAELQDIKTFAGHIHFLESVQKIFSKNAIKNYISDTFAMYNEFRQERQDLYVANVSGKLMSQHELDILLLAFMEIAKDLDDGSYDWFFEKYTRLQVFVDELTDFSPVQLKIMFNLFPANKKPVFFGTGDFVQRLTKYGIQNERQLAWAVPEVQIQELKVPYRQTKRLAEFTQLFKKASPSELTYSKYYNIDGLDPVLGTNLKNYAEIAAWIKKRVSEIDLLYGFVPSIAVLAESEDAVQQLTDELTSVFAEDNIGVEACLQGKVLGARNNIRVFCLDYIKGLEFEAVFFVNLDKLKSFDGLLKNFLYVGASRATMFFGVTTTGNVLPQELVDLSDKFKSSWNPVDTTKA